MGAFGQAFNSEKYDAPLSADPPHVKWDLNDGAGTIANDTSGNNHDGTLRQGAYFANDYVIVGGHAPANEVSGSLAACVARPTNTGVSVVLETYLINTISERAYFYFEDTSVISYGRFGVRAETDNRARLLFRDSLTGDTGGANSIYGQTLSSGQWYFIAGRVDLNGGIANLTVDFTQTDWSGSTGTFTSTISGSVIGNVRNSTTVDRKTFRVRNMQTFETYISDQQMSDIRTSLGYTP